MNSFSISQLARFSGIKAHTIRIWEQRYNALQPNRSEGNTRYYDNDQLRRLLNIVSLLETGSKVSELCAMPDKKLFQLINDKLKTQISDDEQAEYFISQLIAAGISYDEVHFNKIFTHCLLRYSLKNAYIKVIYPVLIRVGLMWASDNIRPVQEHFTSNLVRQKIATAIDSLPAAHPGAQTWLLFLPEDEHHEIGLLFAHYLLRLSGQKVIYLGANVPMQSIFTAIKDVKPQQLLLFLVHQHLPEETNQYLRQLSAGSSTRRIYVAAHSEFISQLKIPEKVHMLSTVDQLEKILKTDS